MTISTPFGRILDRARGHIRRGRALLRRIRGVRRTGTPEEQLRAWLEHLVPADRIAVTWREWSRPARWFLTFLLFSRIAGLTPLSEAPLLLNLVNFALLLTTAATAAPVGLRYAGAYVRRRLLLRDLVAQGDTADIGELLRLAEAEIAALPWRPEPKADSLLEEMRGLLVRRAGILIAGPEAVASRSLRAWLFGPTPQGPFPPYAEDLLALIERAPEPEHLPVLLDLRDLTAHLPQTPGDSRIPERANQVLGRLLGEEHRGAERAMEPVEARLHRLLREVSARSPLRRARAGQALRAMGVDAVAALRQLRHQPRWWWRLPTLTSLLGLVAAWLVYREGLGLVDITSEVSFARNITPVDWIVRLLGNQPWAAAVAVYFAFGLAGGILGWVVSLSSGQVRRLCQRTARALSVMEGREAAECLLEVTRTLHKRFPSSPVTLQHRRQCARRLCWLTPTEASDALALHGDWFYKPPAERADARFARDLLAVIEHTWDPAARPLLRHWSREMEGEPKEQAARLLAEIEERMARQGTLVRPAGPAHDTDHLLRVPQATDTRTDALVRPAEAAGVGGAYTQQPEDDAPNTVAENT